MFVKLELKNNENKIENHYIKHFDVQFFGKHKLYNDIQITSDIKKAYDFENKDEDAEYLLNKLSNLNSELIDGTELTNTQDRLLKLNLNLSIFQK